MRMLMVCSACLAVALPPGAALAKSNNSASATCEAKYYDYLVGKNLDSARDISGTTNYRVLANGAAPGAAQPKRMTITVDPRSNQILNVACG